MESSSLPNFVRFATSNINRPKKDFWLYVGTTDFLIGVLIYFLCIFCRVSPLCFLFRFSFRSFESWANIVQAGRGFRVFGIPFTWFGCMQFYSATQDLCFQVYGRRARQLYPWDIEEQNTTASSRRASSSTEDKDLELGAKIDQNSEFDFDSLSEYPLSISAGSSRSRMTRKSKVFEDEVPIEDEYVKIVQRARYIRVWVVATVLACAFVAVFLGVPNLPR